MRRIAARLPIAHASQPQEELILLKNVCDPT